MAGREDEALSFLRGLFTEKTDTDINALKLRIGLSSGICAYTKETSGDARQKASEHLLDAVARDFGGLNGVGAVLSECYREFGQERMEQDDPSQAIAYFKKALTLNPDDADSVAGVIIANIANDTPAEGRKYLQEHAQLVIEKTGRDNYNANLSYLYGAEAKQAERDKDYARAEQLLREALKVLPGEHSRIISLADVLEREGKSDEARNLLKDAEKKCGDEACRQEYTAELERQEQIEQMLKRLEQK